MSGIKEVWQLDEKHLHWKAEIGGKTKEWDAEISGQVRDQRIAWRSTSGAENSGTMHFIAVSAVKTRVILYLSYSPRGFVERMGNNLGIVSARVSGDLNRFKKFAELLGSPLEDGLIPTVLIATIPRIN